ncbi:LysM peptidoglycan-binding domain-containing protein [Laceyella putida]|uniref:LysM peptidoglycan-binding domain-containing protein n=1 Tax=Laceyella putida TaxID=110101 RepID=A0ABW2RFL0_9BACL
MQIHVVTKGQTLPGIAQAYSVSADVIQQANQLPNPQDLVPGQALVIPILGRYYWVRPGDTLYRIARRFGVTLLRLAQANRLSLQNRLRVGMRLYIPPTAKRRAEINAYIEPPPQGVSEELRQETEQVSPYLTYLSIASYRVQRDGSLQAPDIDQLPAIAPRHRVALAMVLTNQEGAQFSDELGHIILTNTEVQDRLLSNIIETANRVGYRDIHFDFEFLPVEDREAYNRFLEKAVSRLRPLGFTVATALAPKTSGAQRGEWYEAHDYPFHGRVADFVVLMTYEWGYSGGPPMAVSPINEVRKVVDYAVSVMPANKISLGQNLYGYDWTLPYRRGNPPARGLNPQQALEIAAREDVEIQYDRVAQAPHFDYTDDAGRRHTVWFEDARSIQAKIDLVKELSLRGLSYWRLGQPFPQNWLLIGDQFQVAKKG